jgi:hypothetical protein
LVFSDGRLRVDAEMQAIEVVDTVTETFMHRSQEAAQSIRFVSALDLCNPAVFNG